MERTTNRDRRMTNEEKLAEEYYYNKISQKNTQSLAGVYEWL